MRREGAAAAGILALFFAFRIPLLVVRQLFFDELFTKWIAAKSFGAIVDALRWDSGPPLYYFLVHLFGHARGISLIASLAAVVLLLVRRQFFAAAFVAVFPPSVLVAADGRSYALCALFITIGLLFEKYDALAFVAAAYSHFYGVLFFPLLIRKPKSLALAVVLFIPGFWLAAHQPAAAREWMTNAWPEGLFVRPPLALAIVGGLALLASLRLNRYLAMFLVPLALALILRVYVPMRFESVIAVPLALTLAESLRRQRGMLREVFASILLGAGAIWSLIGIIDHAGRLPDDYRRAAEWLAHDVPVSERVVASGYLYLETIMNGRPDALAFPAEQAIHPGWRALARSTEAVPHVPFIWIGERSAGELAIVARGHRVEPLYINARAMVARIR